MMESTWDGADIPNPGAYELRLDIPYTEDAADPMRTLWLSCPRGRDRFPTVAWIHGGGMELDQHECPPILYDGRLAVAEIRHRVSPAVKAPAYHEDAAAAIAWVLTHIAGFGGDPHRVFVGGMSAGAYLAAIVCMDPDRLAPYGFGPRDIAGLLLVSGQMTTHFRVKEDLGYPGDRYQPVVDDFAPLFHLSPNLPPMLLVTGDPACDIAARAEENAFMAASLKAMGHPRVECRHLPGRDHGGAFQACDPLVAEFLAKLLPQT